MITDTLTGSILERRLKIDFILAKVASRNPSSSRPKIIKRIPGTKGKMPKSRPIEMENTPNVFFVAFLIMLLPMTPLPAVSYKNERKPKRKFIFFYGLSEVFACGAGQFERGGNIRTQFLPAEQVRS